MPPYFMNENFVVKCDIKTHVININYSTNLQAFPHACNKSTVKEILLAVIFQKINCDIISHFFTASIMKRKNLNHCKRQKLNNTMQKNNATCDNSSSATAEVLSPKSENKEKIEGSCSIPSKPDAYSSCSSDSAFYCSSRCLADECFLSAKKTLDSVLAMGERCRNFSESSTVSNISDSSNKEICSLTMNGLANHLRTSDKTFIKSEPKSEVNGSEDIKPPMSILCHTTSKNTSPTVRNIIKEETVSITCKSTNLNNSEEENVHHNLRKKIRKKVACNCCSSSHTTIVVRRLTQIHHTSPTKHCSSPVKSKLKSPSPQKSQTVHISNEYTVTETVTKTSSPSSEKKRCRKQRPKELDKLYADLHEIVWAKNWARDNILSQSCNKRSFSPSVHSNSRKVSSTSKTIVKSSLETFRNVNKSSSNIDKKCKRSLNFLSLKKSRKNSVDTDLSVQPCPDVSNGPVEMSSILDDNSHQGSCSSSIPNSDTNVNSSSVVSDNSNNHVTDYSNGPLLFYDHGIHMDPLSVHTHDDISMTLTESIIEKEVIVNGNDNFSDSDNSSFALDISPSLSGDEISGEGSEVASVLKDSDCNALLIESQGDSEHSNLSEQKSSEAEQCSATNQILEISNENKLPVSKGNTIPEVQLSSEESNLHHNETCVNTEELDALPDNSSEFLLIPCSDAQQLLVENSSICPLIDDELNIVPTELVIEEVATIKPEEVDELPILTASGPVVETSFGEEDRNPPSLEPCIEVSKVDASSQQYHLSQYDVVVFHNDINEIEVEIPNIDEASSSCSIEDLNSDGKQEIVGNTDPVICSLISTDIAVDDKVPGMQSAKMNNFKTAKKQNHCLRKKLLQKYSKLLKVKELPNHETKLSHSIKRRKLKLRQSNEVRSDNATNEKSLVVNNIPSNIEANALITHDKTVKNLPVSALNHQLISSKKTLEVGVREPGSIQGFVSSDGSSSDASDIENISEKRLDTFQKITISTQISPIEQSTLSVMQHSSVYSEFHKKNHALHVNKVTEKRSHLQIMKNSTSELKRKDISSLSSLKKLKAADDSHTRYITFHYEYISVKASDCFMKVIMKQTRGPNIFLCVKALNELVDTLNSAMNDANIRVVILRGAGCCFCSGVDLQPIIGERRKEAAKELSEAIKNFVETLANFHKPLVSVVDGKAVGFGVTLLTYSDIILASKNATFHMPYSELGYFPEGAATLMLPRVIGPAIAMDMMLRGRTLTAQEAKDCRLVSEVVDSEILTQGLISKVKLLEGSSLAAMESTKCMVRMHFYSSLQISLDSEVEMLRKQWLSQACQKALQAANKKGLI